MKRSDAAVILLFIFLFFSRAIFIGSYPGWHADECRYRELSLNYINGHFILDNLKISMINHWVAHGPLFIYLQGLIVKVFGTNPFTMRLLPLIFFMMGVYFCFRLVKAMIGQGAGTVYLIIHLLLFNLNIWERTSLPYVMLFGLYAASAFYFRMYSDTGSSKYLYALAALIAASVLVAFYSFLLSAYFIFYAVRKDRKAWLPALIPVSVVIIFVFTDILLNGKFAILGLREMVPLYSHGDSRLLALPLMFFMNIWEFMTINPVYSLGLCYLIIRKELRGLFVLFVIFSALHFIRPVYYVSLHQYPITAYAFPAVIGASIFLYDIFVKKGLLYKAAFMILLAVFSWESGKVITRSPDYPLSHLAMNDMKNAYAATEYLNRELCDGVVITTRHYAWLIKGKKAEFTEWNAYESLSEKGKEPEYPADGFLFKTDIGSIKYIIIDPYFFNFNIFQDYVKELNGKYRFFEIGDMGAVNFLWPEETGFGQIKLLRNPGYR